MIDPASLLPLIFNNNNLLLLAAGCKVTFIINMAAIIFLSYLPSPAQKGNIMPTNKLYHVCILSSLGRMLGSNFIP